ncbi:MAG: AAA family ATPase [Thomasclavelia sp.]
MDLLYDLKLDFLLEQHPYDLSGGQMQLVAFIKILARKPKLILLDEPTKGLDAYYKEKIGDLLEKLADKITVIIVSHDLEFCARYAKRIGMMFDGRIESIDKTDAFFSSNLFYTTIMNKLTREFLDNVNIIEDINMNKNFNI